MDAIIEIECAVFDFDGTLAPNLDLPEMRRRVLAHTQAHAVPESVIANKMIVEVIDGAKQWLQTHQEARFQTTADSYATAAHRIITDFELEAAHLNDPYPFARPMLSNLRNRGLSITVVTRNCEAAVRQTFPDIDDFIDAMVPRDNLNHLKPDPHHINLALSSVQARASHSLMIGDARTDMQVGKALGMRCIGVLSGSGVAEDLRHAGATVILDHAGLLVNQKLAIVD